MSARSRKAVEAAAALARSLGFTVRESDLRDLGAGIMLDVEGHGELVELYYVEHRGTGFLRWKCAYVHRDNGRADLVRTWRNTRDLLTACAAGWEE